MAWTFNPFSGTFDQKGSGSGSSYLEGEVQNFSALPTATPPAVDAAYLVREAEGAWLLSRKPSGIYIRVATTGTRATDWQYAGEFPDVFNDANLVIYNNADSTKNVKFDVSAVATGTTRTITVPNRNVTLPDQDLNTTSDVTFDDVNVTSELVASSMKIATQIQIEDNNNYVGSLKVGQDFLSGNRNYQLPDASGTISLEGHTHAAADVTSGVFDNARINFAAPAAIGSTTRNSGTFTTLAANNGTQTTSNPAFILQQTWNASGVVFHALEVQVTNTASSSNSTYFRAILGANSEFEVRRGGNIVVPASGAFNCSGAVVSSGQVSVNSTGNFSFTSGTGAFSGQDTFLRRDAAGVLAQYNGSNPQRYNLYGTYTSATNFERLFLEYNSTATAFRIGTEKGSGGGTARDLDIQVDGASRIYLSTSTSNIDLRAQTTIRFGNPLFINGGYINFGNTGAGDVFQLHRDAIGVMALRNGTQAHSLRIYNTVSGTGNVNFDRANFRWASNEFIIDAEAGGTGTLCGIKIGSATSSLLGFYGATPVDRPATVADPAGGGTIDTEARTAINDIIDRLQELGLIA